MDTRIGDAEREAATAHLGDHFAAGRLEHEEFDERLDAIWSARTRADLDQLFWDLPRPTRAVAAVRPTPPARRGLPAAVPIMIIAVLVAVVVLKGAPLVLLIAAVWFVFLRPRRRRDRGRRGQLGSSRVGRD